MTAYLEYLEQQFALEDAQQRQGPSPADLRQAGGSERWEIAAQLLRPRSKLGTLFGVTRGDIDQAVAALTGDPTLQLPIRAIKRVFDILLAILLILAAAPVIGASAVAIRLTSQGPAFFSQTRLGQHGRPFRLWKLRTLHVDAEQRLQEFVDRSRANYGDSALLNLAEDPRVTRVGRYLRRLSIDELPQLWNVLIGNMSLVGPRPLLPGEAVYVTENFPKRFVVKPGLTGLWQVSGRGNLTVERSLELDLRYVEHWSFGLDLAILRRTARAALSGEGAY